MLLMSDELWVDAPRINAVEEFCFVFCQMTAATTATMTPPATDTSAVNVSPLTPVAVQVVVLMSAGATPLTT